MIALIRVEQRCIHHNWYPLQRFLPSYDKICTFNVSVPLVGAFVAWIENGHIKSTNPIIRKSKSLQWVLIRTHAALLNPNSPNQPFTASPVPARERRIHAPKKRFLWGISRSPYTAQITVYRYNRYITGTNPTVRHVVLLTWTLKQMHANQTARARAPNLMPSYELTLGSPTRVMLPFISLKSLSLREQSTSLCQ